MTVYTPPEVLQTKAFTSGAGGEVSGLALTLDAAVPPGATVVVIAAFGNGWGNHDNGVPDTLAGLGASWQRVITVPENINADIGRSLNVFIGTGATGGNTITGEMSGTRYAARVIVLDGGRLGTPALVADGASTATPSVTLSAVAEGELVLAAILTFDDTATTVDPDVGDSPGAFITWADTSWSGGRDSTIAATGYYVSTVAGAVTHGINTSQATSYRAVAFTLRADAASIDPYVAEVLSDGPWAYWRPGEVTGGLVVPDESPNGRYGVLSGAPSAYASEPLAAGLGPSIQLDGQHLASKVAAAGLGGSDATIEFWVRPTNLQGGQPRDLWSGNDENRFARISDAGTSAGVIQAAIGQSGTQSSPAGLLDNNTTYHVVFRYVAATGVVAVFIDGIKAWETVQGANGFNLSSPPLRMARAQFDGRETRGRWSDFAAYRSALSDARIGAHYAAGSATGAPEVAQFGQAVETDTAAALTPAVSTIAALGRAVETSHAAAITPVGDLVVPLGQAAEQDTAAALTEISTGPNVTAQFGQALEFDVATRIQVEGEPVPIGQAVEFDVALAFAQLHHGVTDNRGAGRAREGVGVASWTPAITPPPRPLATARVTAAAHGPITMAGTQPQFTVSKASIPRHRHRVVIGGVDVTWFRGVETPEPSYQLAEPLLWGPATIALPQVAAAVEQLGVGDLAWLRKGAPVLVQRVDDATGTVVATDYRGLVVDFDISGRELVVGCGGHAQGRAAMRNVQTPIFSSVRDLGRWAYHAINSLGLTFKPRLGPVTGVELGRFGGTSHLEYVTELCARAQARSGRRWTIMPAGNRPVYRMVEKDTTTVHATVFVDDARVVPRLRSDMAEEPNRIYSTGVTPDGQRIRFGVYPGLKQTRPAPYPFDDGRLFGAGTTNDDTDTGDGVTVLIRRLALFGYLKLPDTPGGYDGDVTRAVRALQEDAGLLGTGAMTPVGWEALFDVTATGFDLSGSHIEPAAQRRAVRRWRRTPSGAIIGRNPGYKPSVLKVDRNVDMGAGMRRQQIREWSQVELGESNTANWVGTIDITAGAVLAGDVPIGADVVDADVVDVRELRPGMNLRLANFDGGTLVHLAGINHPGSEGAVSLTVDTRARDALEVWEVIARNRETRSDPSRAWRTDARSSTIAKDSIDVWDEVGGILGNRLECPAGAWTIFEVVAGQEGSVSRLQLETMPVTEFVVAVFGSRIGPRRLTSLVPHPLGSDGAKAWENRTLEREHQLLYAAGDKADPCGYHPGSKGRGANLLTGRWRDAAGFSYRAGPNPVLYVAVWPDSDTHVLPGRIMWNQLEAGV